MCSMRQFKFVPRQTETACNVGSNEPTSHIA
jgi:hypothetical protein